MIAANKICYVTVFYVSLLSDSAKMKARKIKSKEQRSNSLEMMKVFINHLQNIQK